ncbi:hypothetical protein AB0G19_26695 [Streptomyces althioticus]|uniref:hypothetical protein n=1 Tax=Streptomyces althioticus TaxID=83380 RepID=UPI0033C8AE13|nr:hypothetical protein OHA53_28245 [Streptomyces althioticus]
MGSRRRWSWGVTATAVVLAAGCSPGSDSGAAVTVAGENGVSAQPTPTATATPTVSAATSPAPPPKDGTAVLVRCADMEDPYATVEIRNPNAHEAVLEVKVHFVDAYGSPLLDTSNQVVVAAKDELAYRVPAKFQYTDRIAHCEVEPVVRAVR